MVSEYRCLCEVWDSRLARDSGVEGFVHSYKLFCRLYVLHLTVCAYLA